MRPTLLVYLHSVLVVEFALGPQVGEEFASWDVRHEEKEVARVLSKTLQPDLSRSEKLQIEGQWLRLLRRGGRCLPG